MLSLKKRDLIIVLTIILSSFSAYWLTLLNDFTFDDLHSIVENRYLRDMSNLKYLFTVKYFTVTQESSYRPVITFLNFVEYFLFGHNPAGYHFMNIFLHGICAVLIFYFLKRFTGAIVAFFASILHAVHPALSESLCCAAFAEDILCMIFILSSLIVCAKYLCEDNSRGKSAFYLFSLSILYLLSLGSKEASFFLPAGFLVFVPFLRVNRSKTISVLLCLTAVLIFFVSLRFFILVNPAEKPLNRINEFKNWFGAVYYINDYLRLYFFPSKLSVIYPVKPIAPENLFIFVPHVVLFAGLFFAGLYFVRRKKVEGAAILWFLMALAPVSGIIYLKFPFAERFIYIPAFGLHLLTACLLSKLPDKSKKTVIFIFSVLCIVLILRTAGRCSQWKTDLILWKSTLRTAPDSPAVHYAIGKIYQDKNLLKKSESHYIRAINLNPDYLDPYINLAVIYMDIGMFEKALRINDIIISKNPDIAIVHLNNALIYRELKQPQKELESYLKAIKSDPLFFPPYINLSLLYLNRNQLDNAAGVWLKGIEINPEWTDAYINLAKYFSDKSERQKAVGILKQGIMHNPSDKKLRMYYIKMNKL